MIYKIKHRKLRIRRGPGLDHKIIAHVSKGDLVAGKGDYTICKNGIWWDRVIIPRGWPGFMSTNKKYSTKLADLPECVMLTEPDRLRRPYMPRPGSWGGSRDRVESYYALIKYLNVTRNSRYLRDGDKTYCNIYATTFMHHMGVYLPRLWWKDRVIKRLLAGVQGVVPSLWKNNREMNANDIYDWLLQYGHLFGWIECRQSEIQDYANKPCPCVISAKNINPRKSGHITIVIPELGQHGAERFEGVLISPLQSQAGYHNHELFVDNWFEAPEFRGLVKYWRNRGL